MKKIVITLSVAALLSLSALGLSALQSVSADCASTNSIIASLATGSVSEDGLGNFWYAILVELNMKGKPFMGQVAQATGSTGVDKVTYSPSYWFPKSCNDPVLITVRGKKVGFGPHLVNTQVDVGPSPNAARTLDITPIP